MTNTTVSDVDDVLCELCHEPHQNHRGGYVSEHCKKCERLIDADQEDR